MRKPSTKQSGTRALSTSSIGASALLGGRQVIVAITAVYNIWTLVALATATSEDLGRLDLGAPARPALSPRTGRKAQS